jgi:HAD superfamily hydrolase (TIGR01509 family)
MLKALLWDVDGTLAETERDGHRVAFNRAFATAGVPWCWDEPYYGELLQVSGGRERLLHDMSRRADAPDTQQERAALAAQLHGLKNSFYEEIVRGGELGLRAGVSELFADCREAGVRMAIATTTSGGNVEALLRYHLGSAWRSQFAAVLCAEEAPRKKPDPQVYQLALAQLQLRPQEVVAMEDAPAGVMAAGAVDIRVVVAHSYYFPVPAYGRALASGPSLGSGAGWQPYAAAPARRITLEQIVSWQRRAAGERRAS